MIYEKSKGENVYCQNQFHTNDEKHQKHSQKTVGKLSRNSSGMIKYSSCKNFSFAISEKKYINFQLSQPPESLMNVTFLIKIIIINLNFNSSFKTMTIYVFFAT